jgi:dTDP-4-dehydrorhamnose reductase
MILVLGSNGMLGHKMVERLQVYFSDVIGASRADFDATNAASVRSLLLRHRPQVVVNCVGVIKQRNQEAKLSLAVNAGFPHLLQYACYEQGAYLVHFSTDCVFSGSRGQYTEGDKPDAIDVYGVTKCFGEIRDADNALTLRTSIIGRERSNYHGLLEWFLRQEGTVNGYKNAIFTGVTTNWLSDVVAELLPHQRNRKRLHGLYQVAAPPVSKFRLLQMFQEIYNQKVEVIPVSEPFCDRSLKGDKFQQATGIVTPDLKTLITEQKDQDAL